MKIARKHFDFARLYNIGPIFLQAILMMVLTAHVIVVLFWCYMHLFHVAVACFYHSVGNDIMMINKIAQYVLFRSMQPPNVFCFDHFEYQVDSVSHH